MAVHRSEGLALRQVMVTVRAPAKVNVQLSVGGRREDGFHELANVYMAVSRYDVVTASPADRLHITISGHETRGVPTDESNLAVRAAILLAERSGREPRVHLHINKQLPVSGGVAGGSADAAGALVACDALWQLGTPRDELLAIASELGSDVPFSLLGGVALGRGRGEQLTSLPCRSTYHWVFAVAHTGLSTPEVYRAKERQRQTAGLPHRAADLLPPQPRRELLEAMAQGSVHQFAVALHNDLEDVAVGMQPQLATTIAAGKSAGALAGILCGTGATTAFLASDKRSAQQVARQLRASATCASVFIARGPVPGPTAMLATAASTDSRHDHH